MDTITLNNMTFVANHGFYEPERRRGNTFEVDIEISNVSLEEAGQSDDLSRSVNYEEIYKAVKTVMEGRPVKLLETLAEQTGMALGERLPRNAGLTVRIRKLNPPLGGPCSYAQITRTWPKP